MAGDFLCVEYLVLTVQGLDLLLSLETYGQFCDSVCRPPCEDLPWVRYYTHRSSVRTQAEFFWAARTVNLFCESREHFSPQEKEHPSLSEKIPPHVQPAMTICRFV